MISLLYCNGYSFSPNHGRPLVRTPSAFSTHSRVSGFIKHAAFLDDLAQKEVVPRQTLPHLQGRANEKVHGEPRLGLSQDFNGLVERVPSARHDHQQVNIGICGRLAVGIRAKVMDEVDKTLLR